MERAAGSQRPAADEVAQLLQAISPEVVAGLASRLAAAATAEDAVQEALIRAWERTARGDRIDAPAQWVARVAANVLHDRRRRERAEQRALARPAAYEPGLLDGIVPSATWPGGPDDPATDALAALVARLPPRQHAVVALHYYADLSVDDVAARLGVSQGTVKQCLFRARRTLRAALEARFPRAGASDTGDVVTPHSQTERTHQMKGWHMAGSHPREYAHGIAEGERYDGKPVAFVRCTAAESSGFGTLMQMIDAAEYRGQRIRFSAAVRSVGVEGWAGLWMRVDGPVRGVNLAFDNMQSRPIKGTTGWQRYAVVLDVAPEARAFGLGVLLHGKGELGVSDFRFEPVGTDVPTTELPPPPLPLHPQNLTLEED